MTPTGRCPRWAGTDSRRYARGMDAKSIDVKLQPDGVADVVVVLTSGEAVHVAEALVAGRDLVIQHWEGPEVTLSIRDAD